MLNPALTIGCGEHSEPHRPWLRHMVRFVPHRTLLIHAVEPHRAAIRNDFRYTP